MIYLKKILYISLWLFCLGAGENLYAKEPKPSNLSPGKVILNLENEADNAETSQKNDDFSLPDYASYTIEVGKYLDETYSGDDITKDFSSDIKYFYPDWSADDVAERTNWFRDGIKIFRWGKGWYDKIKALMLVPDNPAPVYDEDDYEKPQRRDYIESDEVVVVPDFKKVVSYSYVPKDFKAYEEKYLRELRQKNKADNGNIYTPEQRLLAMFSKFDWGKWFMGGRDYSPLPGYDGYGDWDKINGIIARLELERSALDDLPQLKGVIHFYVPFDKVLLLNLQDKPEVALSGDNLQSYKVFLPVFERINSQDKQFIGRNGGVALPFEIVVKDNRKPFVLKAQIKAQICDEKDCLSYIFTPQMNVEAGVGFASGAYNYIAQSHLNLPKDESENFRILSLSADDDKHELRLRLQTDVSLSLLDVLVENDEGILFSEPRFGVYDDYVDVFLQAQNSQNSLVGKKFWVSVKSAQGESLRRLLAAEKMSWSEIVETHLSFALLLAAFFGGLILNFMPCVFPVLALKLLSVTKFGGVQQKKVRLGFAYSTVGIFAAFALLVICLCLLKKADVSLGWGIQFQSGIFLMSMLLALCLFLAYIWGIYQFETPRFLRQYAFGKNENFAAFVAGVVVVLMSTPCSAPYLATAVGFALTGTYLDIISIFSAIALGVALPYILVALFPVCVRLLPKPGRWMRKVENFMVLMLFLTMIWLLSILYGQVSSWCMVRIVFYLILFMVLLLYRHGFIVSLSKERMDKNLKAKIKLIWQVIFSLSFLGLFVVSLWDVKTDFDAKTQEITQVKKSFIDMDDIKQKISEGKTVIVSVDAKWCLTCRFNDLTVLNMPLLVQKMAAKNIELIRVDWTSYNPDIIRFMAKYGRSGVPFYVLFSRRVPEGMVLPEILTEKDFRSFLDSYVN